MFTILDAIFYLLFSIPVAYLAIFAILSLPRRKEPSASKNNARKMVLMIPAYKEDSVIFDSVGAALIQDYPKDKFEIVVISDKMKKETNDRLLKMPIRLIEVFWENSSKAISIHHAIHQLEGFDVAIVLDADNVIEPLFLQKINASFESGSRVVQAHRMAKNVNNSFAILDAISEEINNSIFRKGHANAGLSAALIGSGMAFEFDYYKELMGKIESVGGEDKELEHLVLYDGVKIDYLHHAEVLDEKIQRPHDFSNQRKRWLSAQFEMLGSFLPHLGPAILKGNLNFCDKVFQMALPPRILLLGFLVVISSVTIFVDITIAEKWITLLGVLFLTLLISIPLKYFNRDLLKAIFSLPHIFLLMTKNLFKLKGAGKQFIHTPHGIDEK